LPKKTEETADQVAREAFREALLQVRDEIAKIRSGKIKPKNHTPTETVAFLAKQASSIYSELRKAEAADHKRSSQITKALVLEWFRTQLDQTEQQRFLRELQTFTTKRSGLA
jgi:hypothetical protein